MTDEVNDHIAAAPVRGSQGPGDGRDTRESVVLVAEPDRRVRMGIRAVFASYGVRTLETQRADEVADLADRDSRVAAAIVDVMVGGGQGPQVCRELRSRRATMPVIATGKDVEPIDVILSLELGADQFVAKPSHPRELLARLAAMTRRGVDEPDDPRVDRPMQVDDLVIDIPGHRVLQAGRAVSVTKTEFRILACLAADAGRVMSTRRILTEVWGSSVNACDTRRLAVNISRLRRKLDENDLFRYVVSVPGVGYRMHQAQSRDDGAVVTPRRSANLLGRAHGDRQATALSGR